MKYSFALFGMILFGLMGFSTVLAFQFVTIGNEGDYYSMKEAVEASMYESVDVGYFIETGEIKIAQEKFVTNFTKRFVKNTIGNSEGYTIEFYDIMEYPPKVSVVIRDETSSLDISESNFTVVNNLTGILEANKVEYDTLSLDDLCIGTKKYQYGYATIAYYSYIGIYSTYTNQLANTYYILNKPNTFDDSVWTDKKYEDYFKLSDSVSVADLKNSKSMFVSKIEFAEFVDSVSSSNPSLKYSHFKTNNSSSFTKINSSSSSVTYDATCDKNYLSFAATSVNNMDVSSYTSDTSPEILKISIVSDDPALGDKCYALAKYYVTWKFGYCK